MGSDSTISRSGRQDPPLPDTDLVRAAGSSSLKPAQDREIRRMHDSGDYNVAEIAALFNISRLTVYRSLDRTTDLPRSRPTPGPRPTSSSTTSFWPLRRQLRPGSPDQPKTWPRSYSGRPRSGPADHLIAPHIGTTAGP
jgi:hypothetical protein